MPTGYYAQPQRYADRLLQITGSRLLSAGRAVALPPGVFVPGSEPSTYLDHGAIVAGRVEINLEVTRESIDLGRVPTPARFYLSAQRCTIRANLQEYQPENIILAAGGDPLTGLSTALPGFQIGHMGGELGQERRVVVVDDFDASPTENNLQKFWQYWFANPNGQAGGTFTRGEEKAQFVIPIEYDFLRFIVNNINRMIEFRAVTT